MASKKRAAGGVLKDLRAFGLAYPGAHLKSPWPGHLDLAVNDKTFAYLSVDGEPFKISCKLPRSNAVALMLPFTEPTPYGLGKSGWVSARFAPGEEPPVELLKAWIDESYRAQAPKKLVKTLPAEPARPETAKAPRASQRAPKKGSRRSKPAPRTSSPKPSKKTAAPPRPRARR
ncbi:MAG TPA: MmcQ/YjbR family DNA-binding protein [Polyangiaceae bacterium]